MTGCHFSPSNLYLNKLKIGVLNDFLPLIVRRFPDKVAGCHQIRNTMTLDGVEDVFQELDDFQTCVISQGHMHPVYFEEFTRIAVL